MSETPQPPPSDNPPPPPPPGDAGPSASSGAAPQPAQPAQPVDYGTAGGYPGPYQGPPPTSDDKTMALLAHILGIPTWFIGPLVIYLMKKDASPFVADQAKEALNFQITIGILYVVAVLTACIVVGGIIAPAAGILNLVFCILAAIETNKGVAYRYPFVLRLVK